MSFAPAAAWAGVVALVVATGLPAPLRAASLFAGRLDATNLARRPGGPDAIGGIGDWALSNGTLCAVVSDPSHESDLSVSGGVLVDLGHCGREDDQFVLLQPVVNLDQDGAIPIQTLRAESSPVEARLVAAGERDGVRLETSYHVDLGEPQRLRVVTRIERRAPGPRLFALAGISVNGERSLRPFAIQTGNPSASTGFSHPAIDDADGSSVARATTRADLQVLVGADAIEPGIAYGVWLVSARHEPREGSPRALPRFSLVTDNFSARASFVRPFWIGGRRLGLLERLQTLFMDLGVGDAVVHETELWVAARADAASITDRILADGVTVQGRVDDPAARLHVSLADGGAVTFVRPDADGSFAFRVPPERYRVTARAPGGRSLERTIRVDAEPVELGTLALAAPARLALGGGAAMRLVFRGLGGTPDPVFRDDLIDFRIGELTLPASVASNDLHLAGAPWDPTEVVVSPGRYRVLASRGPEYTVSETLLELGPGETARLEVPAPVRAVATPNWIGADLHVHAAPSDDSSLPRVLRLASYLANGAEVLVATDHDHTTDYAPLVDSLGLSGRLASLVGVEVTTSVRSEATPFSSGHANVFPVPYRPEAYRKGAPAHEGRRLREIVAGARALGGERVVQLNHPRGRGEGFEPSQYFTHLAVAGRPFDPRLPLSAEPNRVLLEPEPASGLRDLDFDAIELLNGPDLDRYRAVREDWFALLRQGEVRTGTANSDSHRLLQVAAVPRSYVQVGDDTLEAFDEAGFVRALREGRVQGSTGPLLRVRLGDAGIGERFVGASGLLQVEVRAAPWVPVAELRVYVDGVLRQERTPSPGVPLEIPLRFHRDGFVTVEVEGPSEGIYAELCPGFTPFAFTNPIFVDADADGSWVAPGLP